MRNIQLFRLKKLSIERTSLRFHRKLLNIYKVHYFLAKTLL